MTSIDLMGAHFRVSILPCHKKYLHVTVGGQQPAHSVLTTKMMLAGRLAVVGC